MITKSRSSTAVDTAKNKATADAPAVTSTSKHDVSDKIKVEEDASASEKDNGEVRNPTDATAPLGAVFKAAELVRDDSVDVIPAKAMEGVRVTPLSDKELKQQLLECETTISKGLNTFVQVGTSLAKIRDKELFNPPYATFDLYLEARWNITKQRASQLILAADTHTLLSSRLEIDKLPITERAMRELLKAPKDKQAQILTLVAEEGEPTTERISKVRDSVVDKKPKKTQKKPAIKPEAAMKAVERWAAYLEVCDAKAVTDEQRKQMTMAHNKAVEFFNKLTPAA